jgi:hypothetical protein
MEKETGLLGKARTKYHEILCRKVIGRREGEKGINIADTSSQSSRKLAQLIVDKISCPLCPRPPKGQQAGSLFAKITEEFLQESFSLLSHIRPGKWVYSATGASGIGGFDQYQHLLELKRLINENRDVKAAFGGDYFISPDIIVARLPMSDQEINEPSIEPIIIASESSVGTMSPLRASNHRGEEKAILHASISCKLTMRSDRSQNTRTEALNLIRNRKGRTPHIVAVTLEPLPTRLASIAMGTGDIDCTYHAALHELVEALHESEMEDQEEMLFTLIEGRRLRDISDLPFDLAI